MGRKNPTEDWFGTPERITLSCISAALHNRGITSRKCGAWFTKNMPWWCDFMEHETTCINALVQRGHKALLYKNNPKKYGNKYRNEQPWVNDQKKPYWNMAQSFASTSGPHTKKSFQQAVDAVVRKMRSTDLFAISDKDVKGDQSPLKRSKDAERPNAIPDILCIEATDDEAPEDLSGFAKYVLDSGWDYSDSRGLIKHFTPKKIKEFLGDLINCPLPFADFTAAEKGAATMIRDAFWYWKRHNSTQNTPEAVEPLRPFPLTPFGCRMMTRLVREAYRLHAISGVFTLDALSRPWNENKALPDNERLSQGQFGEIVDYLVEIGLLVRVGSARDMVLTVAGD